MAYYTDATTTIPESPAEREPVPMNIQPAEVITTQMYERYSIAEAIHNTFVEMEQNGYDDGSWDTAEFWSQEYPSDTDAFRLYMRTVQTELRKHPSVMEVRQLAKSGQEIPKEKIERVFHAYAEVVSAAARKLRETLSPEQLHDLKQAGRDQLDWNYRHLLVEHATAEAGAPLKYSIEDFFLMINPKARKVQYMESNEILRTLRHSMSNASTDRLSRDVHALRQYEADRDRYPAIADVLDSNDFTSAEEQLNTSTN